MSIPLHPLAESYVRATNGGDPEAFVALFAPDAVVEDAGRVIRGHDAIGEWCRSDIFDVNVSLEVLGSAERDGQIAITSRVDGTFDRTGLPDPLVIEHAIAETNGRIVRLTCRLAGVAAPA